MANFGTYEGHRILSQAMDSTLNRQLERDRLNAQKKSWEIQDSLNAAKTEEYKAQLQRDQEARQREKLLSNFAKDAWKSSQGMGSLFVRDPNDPTKFIANENTDLLLESYRNNLSKGALIDADVDNILKAEDLVGIEKHLAPLAQDQITNIRMNFNSMSDADKKDWLNNYGDQLSKMRIAIGQDDPAIDNEEFLSSSNPVAEEELIKSGVNLDGAWGTGKEFDIEGGSEIEFRGYSNPSKTAQRDGQMLMDAISNNMSSKADNILEADNVKLKQIGPNEWELHEDDFDLGTGIGTDKYEVKIINGKPMINMAGKNNWLWDGEDDWQDLNKADF